MRRLLLFLTAVVVLAGLASHLTGRQSVRVEGVTPPPPTPVTPAIDETVTSREITLPAITSDRDIPNKAALGAL